MFIFKEGTDTKLCQNCETLKTLPTTKHFPNQTRCLKSGVTCQQDCEKIHPFLHQCDDCALLGKKTNEKGITYVTCLSPQNTKFFGYWVKAITPHAYFCRNEICKLKQEKEK